MRKSIVYSFLCFYSCFSDVFGQSSVPTEYTHQNQDYQHNSSPALFRAFTARPNYHNPGNSQNFRFPNQYEDQSYEYLPNRPLNYNQYGVNLNVLLVSNNNPRNYNKNENSNTNYENPLRNVNVNENVNVNRNNGGPWSQDNKRQERYEDSDVPSVENHQNIESTTKASTAINTPLIVQSTETPDLKELQPVDISGRDNEESCTTVDGGSGNCVVIFNCQPYLGVLMRARGSATAKSLLKNAHCGFDKSLPKVCCPPVFSTVPPPITNGFSTAPPPITNGFSTARPSNNNGFSTAPPPITNGFSTARPSNNNGFSTAPPSSNAPFTTTTPKPADTTTLPRPISDETDGVSDPPEVDLYDGVLPDPPTCGISNATWSRVVGGVPAKLGDFPWMALLGYANRLGSIAWRCGGSLITDKHVLSAAHCVHNHENDLTTIRLGELVLEDDNDGATPIDILIQKKIKHEGYNPKSFTNDISVLVLKQTVTFTHLIRPVCIMKAPQLRSQTYENYKPMIAGWGAIGYRKESAMHLQVLQIPVVSNEYCAQAFSSYKSQVIDRRVLCAGYKNGGKDACQGDSGGPLLQPIYNSETKETFFYQLGVVSYGKECALANFPGVYSRVTFFTSWIHDTVMNNRD